jgi:hypothetical protein
VEAPAAGGESYLPVVRSVQFGHPLAVPTEESERGINPPGRA